MHDTVLKAYFLKIQQRKNLDTTCDLSKFHRFAWSLMTQVLTP